MPGLALAAVLGAALAAACAAWAVAAEEPPKGLVRPLDPATNAATGAKVALGAKLFADVRLSVDDKVACASCHVAELAFTDGHARARGHNGKELARNAPTLLNVALLPRLFWDGRAATLEEQARIPILHPDEMAMPSEEAFAAKVSAIDEYPPLFEKAFGDRAVTLQRAARALAAFQRTLLAGDAPFDRWWRGDESALDDAARRGYRLFVDRAGCSQCHSLRQSYATFSDGDFHNTGAGKDDGLKDRGRAAVTGRREDEGAFRTPTLRNVALTAPFMHDGSLATLEEVVDFYADGGRANPNLSPLIRPLELDDRDRADLVAFLRALTSGSLPTLEECDALLREGRPADAFEAFRRELDERQGGDRALLGMASSARIADERTLLLEAERRLRLRLSEASPGRTRDAEPDVQRLLETLAEVTWSLAQHEDAMALAREDDAVILWQRIRDAAPAREDLLLREVQVLERRERVADALAALANVTTPENRALRAAVRFRRGWRGFEAKSPSDADRADLLAAADELDALHASGETLDATSLLLRANARAWLGDGARARAAYLDAARVEASAEKALRGLRNLLARDLPAYRADLEGLARAVPGSPTVLYFAAWEALEEGRLDGAESLLRRRLEAETEPAPGSHLLLARVERRRGRRAEALSQYAVALALDGGSPALVSEYESYLRERVLRGFADVAAMVDEFRTFLDAGPDDARFQALTRNNLAFQLRDAAASYTSRGPARLHVFAEGAPPEAKDTLRLSLRLYEEAAARTPEDVADLEFRERWVWAGVWNDLGLMLHYFPEIQDLPRAEACYLKAFELTNGAYQDAYFYNLQFLYAFELTGRDERWLDLADRARRAILREDPASPTGFAPDEMKRTAARRDFERLAAKLGR